MTYYLFVRFWAVRGPSTPTTGSFHQERTPYPLNIRNSGRQLPARSGRLQIGFKACWQSSVSRTEQAQLPTVSKRKDL